MSDRPLRLMLADPPLEQERYTYYHPTMGILYLLGAVKAAFPQSEVECRYLQAHGDLKAHLEAVDAFAPDIYGLSFKSPMARTAYRTLHAVRDRFPDLTLIAGGSHASALPDEVMERTPVDACFVGECESTLVQMLETASAGTPRFAEIPGVLYRDGGGVQRNEPQPHHPDLDAIPWPAWDLVDPAAFTGAFYKKGFPYLGVLVSRGCPYQCIFCSEPVWRLFGRSTYRSRSPRAVVEEVERHYQVGVREVRLWCEELNNDRTWFLELMDGLAGLGHDDLFFSSDLRANNLTEEMADAMARARMWLVHMGMESGSDRTLAGLKKETTTAQIEGSCQLLASRGIRVLGYFQFYSAWEEDGALCWEGAQDAQRTIDWFTDMNRRGILDYVATGIASPRLDTPLWDIATRHGLHRPPADPEFQYLTEGMNLPGVSPGDVRRTMLRSNFEKMKMGVRSGNVTFRDVPFYLWRNVRRLARA